MGQLLWLQMQNLCNTRKLKRKTVTCHIIWRHLIRMTIDILYLEVCVLTDQICSVLPRSINIYHCGHCLQLGMLIGRVLWVILIGFLIWNCVYLMDCREMLTRIPLLLLLEIGILRQFYQEIQSRLFPYPPLQTKICVGKRQRTGMWEWIWGYLIIESRSVSMHIIGKV